MGANAQTSVPAFVTGQVLTAQQQTEINTGIPVFADSTARDAAFGGTGEKVLAEGQYAYLESTNQTLVYDGSSWLVVGASGLTLISATTIGTTVASVTVTGAFSATYDNYLIIVNGGIASTNNSLVLTLGATTTGYYYAGNDLAYSSTAYVGLAGQNQAIIRWILKLWWLLSVVVSLCWLHSLAKSARQQKRPRHCAPIFGSNRTEN
jgi:hypothetical protein